MPSNPRLPAVQPPSDTWYLTNGIVATGPTPFDGIARLIAEGRVARSSFVRHASWSVWQRYEDLDSLDTLTLWHLVKRLAQASENTDARTPPSARHDTLVPSGEEAPSAGHPPRVARSSIRPVAVDPVGVLGQARNMNDALLLTLSTAVAAASAHMGAIHRYQSDVRTAVTTFVQGNGGELLLGLRLPASDPSLSAAHAGTTVIGEPNLGDTGRHIAARFLQVGCSPVGVAMVPIRLFDSLVALIEVAQLSRAFTAREISRVEDVADVLAERLVVNGWFEVPS